MLTLPSLSFPVVGIIAGPYVTGGFDPRKWGGAEHEVSNEITLVRRWSPRLSECLSLAWRWLTANLCSGPPCSPPRPAILACQEVTRVVIAISVFAVGVGASTRLQRRID